MIFLYKASKSKIKKHLLGMGWGVRGGWGGEGRG